MTQEIEVVLGEAQRLPDLFNFVDEPLGRPEKNVRRFG